MALAGSLLGGIGAPRFFGKGFDRHGSDCGAAVRQLKFRSSQREGRATKANDVAWVFPRSACRVKSPNMIRELAPGP